ncbi:MAG TPA: sulfur carrier protein ThiS [Opitutaceae bacterium]|jgi:sulfur carrier protein|nr:sulfur carrier protein ThiS [Opitutaceae bacterium]
MSTATQVAIIYVNDQPRPLDAPTTLLALLNELGHAGRKGVAVALNGAVVPRAEWPSRTLADADHVLVIQATQGG